MKRAFNIGRGAAGMLVVLLAASAGCSRLDFSREMNLNPLKDVLDSGKPYVEGGKSDAASRQKRFQDVLDEWSRTRRVGPRDYHVGPGDILSVSILALEVPDRTSTFERTVGSDGCIAIPYVESLRAAGLTVRELEQAIKVAYEGKYLRNPQVTVNVTAYQSVAVVITGAVSKPGVYYLEEDSSTVLEMLGRAGGLSDESAGEVLLVRAEREQTSAAEVKGIQLKDGLSGSEAADAAESPADRELRMISIDLKQLVDTADMRLNLEVGSGDVLSVPSSRRQYIYVLGYVARPGAHEIRGGQDVDALRAVAMAGGLSPQGRADKCSLLREEKGRQKVIEIDLIKMSRGVRPLLYLSPGDTLIVGTSFLARASEIVRPSIGAGMSYSPGVP